MGVGVDAGLLVGAGVLVGVAVGLWLGLELGAGADLGAASAAGIGSATFLVAVGIAWAQFAGASDHPFSEVDDDSTLKVVTSTFADRVTSVTSSERREKPVSVCRQFIANTLFPVPEGASRRAPSPLHTRPRP